LVILTVNRTMTNNDHYYIEQLRAGNTQVFSGLVNDYKNLVFSLALRMLKNAEEAEEVSQDTFIKVFTKINMFKQDAKLSTWIYRIAYNNCLDRLKSKHKQFNIVEMETVDEVGLGSLEDAFEIMAKKERQEAIKKCFDLLPSEDAALLTLFYYEEKRLQDIEKITDLSVGTLKVRLFRARKKLATVLRNHLEPEMLQQYG